MSSASNGSTSTGERVNLSIVYDAFLSYSHAADDLLAPRLQLALQRFAKPWWKRRAVRIFRDQSSLSANPNLWSSITEALDTSEWFVLLLSPDAAASEWVKQEVAYWVKHRDPRRILPVVTDGEFGWVASDVAGDAVPAELIGVFAAEPRWVDLRFARTDEQLDLKDPRFAGAVADIASTIRGIPKDELASEEVRQHRRTMRTVWAAGMAMLVLAAAAAVAASVAIGQANEAERQRAEAERQTQIAREQSRRADLEKEAAVRQAQRTFDETIELSNVDCIGAHSMIGMKGEITNAGSATRDFLITVELIDGSDDSRIDLLDTLVADLEPDQTALWRVSRYHGNYVDFFCLIVDISDSPS